MSMINDPDFDFTFDDDPPPLPPGEYGYERQLNSLNRELVAWVGESLHPEWWRKSAACKGADQDLFFLDRGRSATAAKAICAGCPVAGACLDFALAENMPKGIFGGMTERERRAEKRRRIAGRVA